MASLRLLATPAKALAELEKAKHRQDFTVVLGDWAKGVQVRLGCTGAQACQQVQDVQERYGVHVPFRLFNQELDLWWWGDGGILCTGTSQSTPRDFLLEPDWRRHFGLAPLRQALGNPPDLRGYRLEAVELTHEEGGPYLRFLRLKPQGARSSASGRSSGTSQ